MSGRRPPRDLRELVGDDVPAEELARLRHADAALRSVPPPPLTIPESLTRRVESLTATSLWTRRRAGAALALAAALSAMFFGIGHWTGRESPGFEPRLSVPMRATSHAPGASALIKLGRENADSGNYKLELVVRGLRKLPAGGYYVLWLSKGGRYAGTCGTFRVGSGTTSVDMNVSYRLSDYDTWVVTAQLPGQGPSSPHPWLLEASIRA
ncbi:MAG: hypothetical protein E6G67_10735 [Actinobacteria bacterium]|nr:MAG: hypothetical protein E6G67_10735 [Actinomycetota bacterium]